MKHKSGRREFLKKSLTTSLTAGLSTSALGAAAASASASTRSPASVESRAAGAEQPRPWPVPAFDLDEVTFTALADGMKSGKYTARAITEKYLERDRKSVV